MNSLEQCLALLEHLVAIPSVSGQEKALAVFLAGYLEKMGLTVDLHDLAGDSANIIGRVTLGCGGRRLYVGGHIDTVAPGSRWTYDPYRLTASGDRLYGLGAGDMKGGLAAQITALARFLASAPHCDGEIVLLGLADEERYSAGANYFLNHEMAFPAETFAVLGEPHFDNIVVGAAGKLLLDILITGRGGHAARPESGVNAIDSAALLVAALRDRYWPRYRQGDCGSHCVLRIDSDYAGYSLNIPERCHILLNKQLQVGEDGASFIRDVRDIYRAVGLGGELAVTDAPPSYASYQLREDEPGLLLLEKVLAERFAYRPYRAVMPSVSDANLFVPRGIPTVLFGPQGRGIHQENEHVSRESLDRYMEMLFSFMAAYFTQR